MVRISELPTRLLALKYGADIVWGPEIVDKALITDPPAERVVNEKLGTIDFVKMPKNQVIFRTHVTEKKRLVFQLGSGTPDLAVQAAKLVANDVAAIDLNCGCPKPFSTTGGMGSALLSDVDRLCAILVALVENVGKPFNIGISAKIRLLDDEDATEAMVRRICRTGIMGLTVHLRTVPMRPREPALRARLARLVQVCKDEKIVLLANGDVKNRDEAIELMEKADVDGIMIARGAEYNPSCFRSARDGGPIDSLEMAREVLRTAEEYDNAAANTKYIIMRILADKSKSAVYRKCQVAKGYAELKVALNVPEEKPQKIRRVLLESAIEAAAAA
jgi:tRNA-dihydrouridine synthase 2